LARQERTWADLAACVHRVNEVTPVNLVPDPALLMCAAGRGQRGGAEDQNATYRSDGERRPFLSPGILLAGFAFCAYR